MKAAKLAATLLLVYVGIVVVFELVGSFYQPTNVGVPLLVITTTAEDGTSNDRILAHLESQGQLFVSANHWPRAWYYRALENPNVQVTLAGEKANYLAGPVSEEELVRLHAYAEANIPFRIRFLSGFAPWEFLRIDLR